MSATVLITCQNCNTKFEDYKSNGRKFCCHFCYAESKKGKSPWNKGTKGVMPPAWNKGLKGFSADYPRSEEWKNRISMGKINSERSRLASKKAAKKMGEATKGENNFHWNGGASFKPYSIDWTKTLRRAIRERDNYICQECGISQNNLKGLKILDVHHIDYDKENCNPDNLITLCKSCHSKTNTNRNYWKNYFEGKKNAA